MQSRTITYDLLVSFDPRSKVHFHNSRIAYVIYVFLKIQKRDFLRVLKWHLKKRKNVIKKSQVSENIQYYIKIVDPCI